MIVIAGAYHDLPSASRGLSITQFLLLIDLHPQNGHDGREGGTNVLNSRLNREVPTVPGRPFIGSTIDFLNRPVGFLIDAFHQHGSVFRVNFVSSHMTFIGGNLARDLLLEPPACPMSREGLFKPFSTEVGVDVFDTEGEAHARGRALLKLPYSRQITTNLLPEMQRAIAAGMENWSAGEPLDLFKMACDLAQRAIMAVVTPIDFGPFAADFVRAGNQVMYAQFRLHPEFSLHDPRYKRAHRQMIEAVDDAIMRHRSGEFARSGKVYLIDACLRAANEAGDAMDSRTIRGTCFYALAGTEIYVGRLVCFFLYELLRNRHFLTNVLEEIDAAYRENDLASVFRRMRHLRAAYRETLRYYPLIPGYSYVTKKDMDFGGFRVGKDEPITFAPYLAHFSSDHYDNPMAFDPARHLRAGHGPKGTSTWTPFGAGSHACGAAGMVETLALTVVTSVLRHVELTLDNPAYEMSLRLAPLITPKKTIWVRAQSRKLVDSPRSVISALAESPDYHSPIDDRMADGSLPGKTPETVPAGAWLIRKENRANAFFVVLEGRVSIWTNGPEVGATIHYAIDPGGSFGDTPLLRNAHEFEAKAERETKVLRFSSQELERLISDNDLTADDLGALYYGRYIKAALRSSLAGIGKAFSPTTMEWAFFEEGALVFRQGDPSDAFYVIVDGMARVIGETPKGDEEIARLGPGEFFGEIGILSSRPRGATVRAGAALKALRIKRDIFLATIAQSPDALADLALTVCKRLVERVRADGAAETSN